MKTKLLILAFLIFSFKNFAQQCGALMEPVSLSQRVTESTLVIEGEVINSQGYWDVNNKNIYTVYTINVYTNMKGNSSTTVKIVTLGGQVGDAIQVTSSEANLQVGTIGTFFLKEFTGNLNVSGTLYQMVAAAQGIVKYSSHSEKASDVFNTYNSIENELYNSIQLTTGRRFQTIQERPALSNTNRSQRATPIVYSFSPLTATAGTETVFTITGVNFGSSMGSVGFSNASDGGASHINAADSQILNWSDTEIQVEIPYSAGTGSILVTNTDNQSHETTVPLTITYSHLNASGSSAVYPSVLQDDDDNGGYTFQYHTDFNTSSAKTYFEAAFELWNCESDVNFTFSGTTTTDESINDGINIVRFDNGSELPTGVLGQVTTRFLGTCPTTNRAIVNEMDITWNDSTNWYYGSGTPSISQYDFKSVALHELGHAHQLGHVIDSDVIMHYSISNGESKYSLDQNDIDGAVYTMGLFTQSVGCGISPMTENIQCCDDIVITTQPQHTTVEANNGTAQFTIVAENYDTVQWEESIDGGDTWLTVNDGNADGTTYSGSETTTLSITNVPETTDLYYRAILTNACSDSLTSDEANLMSIIYTQIPDSNFESALEALGYDDISGDGQVPTALIEVVTSLNVNSQSISDATGLEDFVALEELYIKSNNLTNLDLSTLVNLERIWALNNSLISLDLSNNPLVRDIRVENNVLTSVDFSTLTQLTILQINSNELNEIDLSNNTLLERVRLQDNNLEELDFSNHPNINELKVNNNNLTSFNAQNGNNTNISNFSAFSNPNLKCILVDDASYSTVNWTSIDAQTSFNETSCNYVMVDIDVLLQGALLNPYTGEETLMRDDLRANGIIDNDSPYSDGQVITETINQDDNGEDSMVDWIWVELRDATDPTIVIAGQSAILQRDGDVVSNVNDLSTALTFNVNPDNYYVAISHRNHLGIMTASAIALNQSETTIDFTDANNQITQGNNAQTTFGMPNNVVAMWAGDVNGDGIIQYSGTEPDTPSILSEVLNDSGNFLSFPTYTINGYNNYDTNMDGETQYSGTNPDVPYILQNVLAHPSNFLGFSTYQITEQLP
ncbi:matrixin family metalloprotease [Hanstruepera flava]|uniref:matrixin family metalloprotease n=1 Tax=Hanstruepera flava TaxID=2930218 RepID=UPI002028E1E3|nr:matrixin family metalloprotease [Hanstruepera flava]